MKDNQPPLPAGAMHTRVLTQEMLDECMLALGRPLFSHEVIKLDRILTRQAQLEAKDKASTDRIVSELVGIANRK